MTTNAVVAVRALVSDMAENGTLIEMENERHGQERLAALAREGHGPSLCAARRKTNDTGGEPQAGMNEIFGER